MKPCLLLWLICLCAVFGRSLPAADTPKNVPPKAPAQTPHDPRQAWERRIPMMNLDNLPLGEVVQQLRNDFPELNFLLRPTEGADIDGVSIRLQIRNVTLAEIIKAVELAADRPIQITASPEDRLVVFDFKNKPASSQAQIPIVTRAYSLAAYLSGMNEKEADVAMQQLYEAIHVAGNLTRESTRGERGFSAKLQLHRGTKLLIAVGRADDLEIIDQITDQLRISGPRAARGQDAANGKPTAPATR